MRILLFGGSGQLGHDVKRAASDLDFDLFSPVTSEVDVTDAGPVAYLVRNIRPDVVVNCAAFTAVDEAEAVPAKADAVNRRGAANVAAAAAAAGARVIHVSTDYVFGGDGPSPAPSAPLREDDDTCPVNEYGRSKLAGEREVLSATGGGAVVVRTSSLYGHRGVNFVGTMRKLFAERETVSVVDDQVMSPTWSGWLAEVLLDLCRVETAGVLHAVNAGSVSWFGFASAVLEEVRTRGLPGGGVTLVPTTSAAFARPAPRPRYSVLSTARLERLLGRPALPWRAALTRYFDEEPARGARA